jgi:Protein of unknown function (DUF2752)
MAEVGQGVELPAAGVLLASAALSVVSEEPAFGKPLVALRRPLPDLCPIHRATGHRCPGCGMTRALVLLWHGRPRQAIRSNPASPFVFAALLYLAFAPYRKPQEPETREF